MASRYAIQVVDVGTGHVVHHAWAPGLRVEQEFVDAICERIKSKGVGLARSQAHVLEDVRTAINEFLFDLKSQV